MKVIPLDKFPRSLSGLRRFQTAQILWDEQPDLRPDLASGLHLLCRSINRVVSSFRVPATPELRPLPIRANPR